ncbi:MAG TPA: NlpC/P60 family protein [Solirubrobacteraceae bacterium]|nr:NlpC/P60 family protein [Solirubrobacteraceae bacterium]
MPARALKCALPVVLAGWAVLAAILPSAASAQVTLANWDAAQQRQVVHAGLMSNLHGSDFGGAERLPGAQADRALAALASLASRDAPSGDGEAATLPAVHAPAGLVSVAAFDRLVVDQLGLADVAAHVQRATAAAGLRPPAYYGTEVVARDLGLRYDHPAGTDQLELFPWDPVTRAEAAWSLAQVVNDGNWSIQSARQSLVTYALPTMSADQLTALRIAVSRIGYPYVYAGTTDDTSDGLAHGGFDCSGFVWRVFKVSGLPWGRQIGGRTAAQMAQEIPHRDRLRYDQLRPGDLLFFGSAHLTSTATEANVIHTGIYLGDNWVIHSSGQGVYVLPLKGSWLGDQFAWGRRVLP